MPKIEFQHPVRHSPAKMFALVADVERYPEFVPLCETLNITQRTPTEHGEELIATMGVGTKTLKETFTTRVSLEPKASTIIANYLDGPFQYLENRWRFLKRSDGGCTIDFYISYAFRSPLMGLALGPVFDSAFRRFSKAFEDRADQIYGKAGDQ